jgi:hypothetical protein
MSIPKLQHQDEKMIYERRNCPSCDEINWLYFGCTLDPLAPVPEVCVCFKCADAFWLISKEVVNSHYIHQTEINFVLGRSKP